MLEVGSDMNRCFELLGKEEEEEEEKRKKKKKKKIRRKKREKKRLFVGHAGATGLSQAASLCVTLQSPFDEASRIKWTQFLAGWIICKPAVTPKV